MIRVICGLYFTYALKSCSSCQEICGYLFFLDFLIISASKVCLKGVELKSGSIKGIVEEAPEVYKDIEEVVSVIDELGISKKIARLKPLAVIKG